MDVKLNEAQETLAKFVMDDKVAAVGRSLHFRDIRIDKTVLFEVCTENMETVLELNKEELEEMIAVLVGLSVRLKNKQEEEIPYRPGQAVIPNDIPRR